ncbi:MAG: PA2779 family protein [Gammaproteobacteria bacterium]|nr:PA2779 family protein [Gammaproteobacteria bacterium]
MIFKQMFRCLLVVMAALVTSLPSQAAMVGTAQMQANPATVELVNVAQQREWIRENLVKGGVSETLAVTRVAAMTDAQVAEIHRRIDEVPAAGSGAEVIIIIGLVLMITELMGYTDIIPNWPAE